MGSKVEKSFSTLGLADGILDGVLACVIEAEKKAKSSREIQTIDVSRRGLRQDIYVGKVMVIPPSIMDEPDMIPDPLLKGAVLKLFNGEEAAELALHQLASNEFDKLTPKTILEYKDRVFRDDDGKLGCIVLFQPAWANVRDFHAFRFVKDQEKLKTLLRHLVFSAYYRPDLSALFQTLAEDQVKLDAVNLEHTHLGIGPQLQSDLKSWPLLDRFEKQGGLKTAAFVKFSVDDFVEGYLEAALWSSDVSDDYTVDDFSTASLSKAKEDCETFIRLAGDHLGDLDPNQAGHLFWLNRNVHGEGHMETGSHDIWDQTNLSEEDQSFLATLSDSFGECDIYADEEGMLQLEGGHIPAPLPEPGSGHVLPKESKWIRFASYNFDKIAEEGMTGQEEAVMEELEKMLEDKFAVQHGDAGSVRRPTDPRSGGARQGETEIGDVTKNADGLKARPDYGEKEAVTNPSMSRSSISQETGIGVPKSKLLTSALVEKVLPGPLLEDSTPSEEKAEDYPEPERKDPKVAADMKVKPVAPAAPAKGMPQKQQPQKEQPKKEAPKAPAKAETPKSKAPKHESVDGKVEMEAAGTPKVLNGYTDMREALKSTFAGDDRDNASDHVEKEIDWETEASPKKILDAKESDLQAAPAFRTGNKAAANKEALTYMHPGQILEQFYPDLLNSISGYPMGSPASNYTPPALQRMDGQIMDDEADKVTVSDYSDEGMMHSHGQPGLIQTQDDSSVPLKPSERSIRGPFYSDQFYRIHTDIPPALLTMKSRAASLKKTASDKQKAAIVGDFLKKLCGEIASSLLAAFMTTDRPLFTYSPAYSEIDLKNEQSFLPMNPILTATGMSPYVAQLKSLFDSINDGDLTEAINNAYAQGAVWHESESGRFLYEVFVRIEEVDTEHLTIKYKYLTGTKD